EALDNFRTPDPVTESKYVSLGLIDQLTLTSVFLLRDEGSTLDIVEKVNQVMPGKSFDGGAVFVSLDRLERGRLITSRIVNPDDERKRKVAFSMTSDGARMLRGVRDGLTHLLEALKDLG